MKITKEIFEKYVGHEPKDDDLERCNCRNVSEVGHRQCGWCAIHMKPRFMCGCGIIPQPHDTDPFASPLAACDRLIRYAHHNTMMLVDYTDIEGVKNICEELDDWLKYRLHLRDVPGPLAQAELNKARSHLICAASSLSMAAYWLRQQEAEREDDIPEEE